MHTPAAGRGRWASRSASSVATVRPPPAESPATAMCSAANALVEKPAIGGHGVLDRRRKGMLGRQAVVEQERVGARRARDGGREMAMGARRPDHVAAAVEVEHDMPRSRRRRAQPFRGRRARGHALDLDVGRDWGRPSPRARTGRGARRRSASPPGGALPGGRERPRCRGLPCHSSVSAPRCVSAMVSHRSASIMAPSSNWLSGHASLNKSRVPVSPAGRSPIPSSHLEANSGFAPEVIRWRAPDGIGAAAITHGTFCSINSSNNP